MNKLKEFLEQFGRAMEEDAIPRNLEAKAPRELHLELTYRCNEQCIMCNLRYIDSAEEELRLSEIVKFIEEASLLKDLESIVLSGGEPWLKEDFLEILKFFGERYPNRNLAILTNLQDTEKIVKDMKRMESFIDLNRISLNSSLDGIGKAHDRIRGHQGAFVSLKETLRMLRENYPQVYCSLNFTLTPENCDQLLPTFRWGRENNYPISFQAMVQKEEVRQFIWKAEHCRIIEPQLDVITKEIWQNSGIGDVSEAALLAHSELLHRLLNLHYLAKYVRDSRRFFPNCPCGERFAMLDPMGNLYFCPVHKNKIAGNLRKERFDSLWFSPEASRIRDFFNRKKCHCWLSCTNGYMLGDAFLPGKEKFLNEKE